MNENNVVKSMVNSIDKMTKNRLDKAPYDKTYSGIIVSTSGHNMYSVKINGIVYNKVVSLGEVYNVNQTVKVIVPQGQFNLMYIIGSTNSGVGKCVKGEFSSVLCDYNAWTDITSSCILKLDSDLIKVEGGVITFLQNGRYMISCGGLIPSQFTSAQYVRLRYSHDINNENKQVFNTINGVQLQYPYLNTPPLIFDVIKGCISKLSLFNYVVDPIVLITETYFQILKVR